MSSIKNNYEDEINLDELFILIWKKKLLIILITFFAATLSVIYALSLPNIYTSQTILAPTSEDESLSSKLGVYSGIANFAGIDLNTNSSSKSTEAIRRIKSYDFFIDHFLPYIELKNLLALEEWISASNTIIYNEDLYDDEKQQWVGGVSHPLNKIPSKQEAFREYKSILNISTDKDSGFITLSITHQSPIIARDWVNIIINNINNSMREIDKNKAQSSITFLNEQYALTSIQSIRLGISRLQEAQMQTLMLASSNDEYIFKILESPVIPERKSSPSRATICIVGTLFGGFISLIIVLLQLYVKNSLRKFK